MTGNEVRVVVTDQDLALLRELAQMRVTDREQAAVVMGRGEVSVSTVNIRLLKLVRARLLNRFFIGTENGGMKSLYALSKKGAALIGRRVRLLSRTRDSVLVGDQFVHHQQLVNSILVELKYRPIPLAGVCFNLWRCFSEPLTGSIRLIPDGYFELTNGTTTYSMFLEVDRGTEPQKTWTRKVQLYLQLAASREFEGLFKQKRFRVLVIAESMRRLLHIRRTVAAHIQKVFWFTTFENIKRDSLFGPYWLRPVGDQKEALL